MKHLYNTHNTAMDWIGRAPIMDDVWTQIDQELNPRIHTHTHTQELSYTLPRTTALRHLGYL